MMSDAFAGTALGIIVTCLFFALTSSIIPDSNYNLVHNAIKECEKHLPRDQKCVITAVPEVKK